MHTPTIHLLSEDSWKRFHPHVVEMIITKEKGRKMFPKFEYKISGLNEDAYYIPVLVIERFDNNRYKYGAGEWQTSGNGEPMLREQPQSHCEGVARGKHLMQKKICFDDIRLTNNAENCHNMVLLQSMHKYQPVLYIYQVHGPVREGLKFYELLPNSIEVIAKSRLEFTQFIAVTAYFNEVVKKMKIELNPYAKGHKEEKSYFTSSDKRSPPLTGVSPSSSFSSTERSPQQQVPSMTYATVQPQMFDPSWMSMGYGFNFYSTPVPDVYGQYQQFPYSYPYM